LRSGLKFVLDRNESGFVSHWGGLMTTLVVWISYTETGSDRETPRALYIASDSRITWGSKERRWDAGRKVFVPEREAHAFGYAGDVVFPSLVLGQLVLAIDRDALFEGDEKPEEKHALVLSVLKASHRKRVGTAGQNFAMVHAYRHKGGNAASFWLWSVKYDAANRRWTDTQIQIPRHTSALIRLGSGATKIKPYGDRWSKSEVGGTSRSIFSAFCDALRSNDDVSSGGPPQLVALYNGGSPRSFGVIYCGQLSLSGLPLLQAPHNGALEWRDELFQRVDPTTLRSIPKARRFYRPRSVGS
jgi:hypothetical protein